uniref:Ovule protein n=1 Tax=Brugia timori TaxID=42155 RepID=A0A0R3QAA5_9BILA
LGISVQVISWGSLFLVQLLQFQFHFRLQIWI